MAICSMRVDRRAVEVGLTRFLQTRVADGDAEAFEQTRERGRTAVHRRGLHDLRRQEIAADRHGVPRSRRRARWRLRRRMRRPARARERWPSDAQRATRAAPRARLRPRRHPACRAGAESRESAARRTASSTRTRWSRVSLATLRHRGVDVAVLRPWEAVEPQPRALSRPQASQRRRANSATARTLPSGTIEARRSPSRMTAPDLDRVDFAEASGHGRANATPLGFALAPRDRRDRRRAQPSRATRSRSSAGEPAATSAFGRDLLGAQLVDAGARRGQRPRGVPALRRARFSRRPPTPVPSARAAFAPGPSPRA